MGYSGLVKCFLKAVRLPAKLKGAQFGKNAYIGPGYDFMFVRLKGVVVGDNSLIARRAWIQTCAENSQINIGVNTNIGRGVTISCKSKITIGNGCLFSYGVSILDHDHEFQMGVSSNQLGITKGSEIYIGDNCFIGAHSFVLKGVTLGNNCVVGANSIVTRSFPAGTIIAGNPGVKIGMVN